MHDAGPVKGRHEIRRDDAPCVVALNISEERLVRNSDEVAPHEDLYDLIVLLQRLQTLAGQYEQLFRLRRWTHFYILYSGPHGERRIGNEGPRRSGPGQKNVFSSSLRANRTKTLGSCTSL